MKSEVVWCSEPSQKCMFLLEFQNMWTQIAPALTAVEHHIIRADQVSR